MVQPESKRLLTEGRAEAHVASKIGDKGPLDLALATRTGLTEWRMWSTTQAVSFDFEIPLPVAAEYYSLTGTLLIHGPQFTNQQQRCAFAGQFSYSKKTQADPVSTYLNQFYAPIGFTVPPALSVPTAGTLRVSFTTIHTDIFQGVVSLSYGTY